MLIMTPPKKEIKIFIFIFSKSFWKFFTLFKRSQLKI